MTLAAQKSEMRARMRAACKAMDAETRKALSEQACARLTALQVFLQADCILAYKAMPHECDPQTLVDAAMAMHKRVAFPICEDDSSMQALLPQTPDAFIKGKFGILTPDPERSELVEADAFDLIVTPGVAFDPACRRLGQGAGYYDRYLRKTDAIKIGLAFPMQILSAIPGGALDIPMDMVVTADTLFSRQ